MKLRNLSLLVLASSIVMGLTASQGPRGFFSLDEKIIISTKDNKSVEVDIASAQESERLRKLIQGLQSTVVLGDKEKAVLLVISLPDIESDHLEKLLVLSESPLVGFEEELPVDEIIALLGAEKSLNFGNEVKKALFETVANALNWDDEALLSKVLNAPDEVLPLDYKIRILEIFVQNPEKQKAFVNNEDRPWNAGDLERILKYKTLSPEKKHLIMQTLIEARPGLLETIVGFDAVKAYSSKADPKMAKGSPFYEFAQRPSAEDKALLEDISNDFKEDYEAVKESLLKEYAKA